MLNLHTRCLEPRVEAALCDLLQYTQRTTTVLRLLQLPDSERRGSEKGKLKEHIRRVLKAYPVPTDEGESKFPRGKDAQYTAGNFLRGPRERRHAAILLALHMRQLPSETYTAAATPTHIVAGRPDPVDNILSLTAVYSRYQSMCAGARPAMSFDKFLLLLDGLEAKIVAKTTCACCGSLIVSNTITQKGAAECPTCAELKESFSGAQAIHDARAKRAALAKSAKIATLSERAIA